MWMDYYLPKQHLPHPPPSSTYILAFPISIPSPRTPYSQVNNRKEKRSKTDTNTQKKKTNKKPDRTQRTMCIRTITHWLPCCHQRCTSIELCPDVILTDSNMTTTTREEPKSVEETQSETEVKKNLNPFDCPAGGPVFSDQASKEVCPVCGCEEARNVEGEVDVSAGAEAEAGDDVEAGFGTATADSGDMDEESFDGCQEAEEAETLAALSWESYFDRHGWIG
jgi:hypothetical protein